ncbi:hypothetical protein FXF51_06115 [Nonomuraea sp. PA05]|uniref:hypothetical protein n=1 Tax=Nonomuraea sp. PA05 TaxID=2604466 RepID=UPI0011DC50CC|nr:hypothetical protein [Nonomuraea sp. PA05]TYB69735.1 hypothetical protein FXF51_06115 [Nonomuraea sp. PA05]
MGDQPTGWFRGEGGVIWPMTLPLSEVMAEKLVKGYLTRVNADGTPYVDPGAEGEDPGEPSAEEAPPANANKAAWIGYAHRVHGVPLDEAEALTKHDLMELYGSKS